MDDFEELYKETRRSMQMLGGVIAGVVLVSIAAVLYGAWVAFR